jgi:hypothetical protein
MARRLAPARSQEERETGMALRCMARHDPSLAEAARGESIGRALAASRRGFRASREENMPIDEFVKLSELERYRNYARQLRFWRICGRGKCSRARHCCGDAKACFRRFADWATEVAHEAELEFRRNDPEAKALREELARMVTNLARTVKTEKELATSLLLPKAEPTMFPPSCKD